MPKETAGKTVVIDMVTTSKEAANIASVAAATAAAPAAPATETKPKPVSIILKISEITMSL